MMQLPKFRKDRHKCNKSKICHEPGCGKEFIGHAISKYCEIHCLPRNRNRKRIIKFDTDADNQIIKYNGIEPLNMILKCALSGCRNEFKIVVLPKQDEYPKYCCEHRQGHRRRIFLKLNPK